jgi:hypothetical protein
MAFLYSEKPLTKAQRRWRWIAAVAIVVVAGAVAAWAALDCVHIRFGYVASYSFAAVFFLSIAIAILGVLLLPYWRTRTTGASLVLSGIIMYLTFLGTIEVLKKLDRVAWVHEPPLQHFGPGQQASIVIYYRPGTTSAQIEDFDEHKLQNYPSSLHDGKDFPGFVTEYGALIPDQANGYDGSYLTFKPDAKGPAVDAFVGIIQSDPRVLKTFRDTVPDTIRLPKSEQVPAPNAHTNPHSR